MTVVPPPGVPERTRSPLGSRDAAASSQAQACTGTVALTVEPHQWFQDFRPVLRGDALATWLKGPEHLRPGTVDKAASLKYFEAMQALAKDARPVKGLANLGFRAYETGPTTWSSAARVAAVIPASAPGPARHPEDAANCFGQDQ